MKKLILIISVAFSFVFSQENIELKRGLQTTKSKGFFHVLIPYSFESDIGVENRKFRRAYIDTSRNIIVYSNTVDSDSSNITKMTGAYIETDSSNYTLTRTEYIITDSARVDSIFSQNILMTYGVINIRNLLPFGYNSIIGARNLPFREGNINNVYSEVITTEKLKTMLSQNAEFNNIMPYSYTSNVGARNRPFNEGNFEDIYAENIESKSYMVTGLVNKWKAIKHPNNPIIEGTTFDSTQFYPQSPIKVDDNYYIAAKSGGQIWGKSSKDGITWSNDNDLITVGTTGAWHDNKAGSPIMRYYKGEYYLFFMGRGPQGDALGVAKSSSPLSGYSTAGFSNPIYTPADFNADFNTDVAVDYVYFSDLIYYDDEWLFYGTANDTNTTASYLFCATAETLGGELTGRNIIFDDRDANVIGRLLQSPSVIQYQNTFVMLYTAGSSGGAKNQRKILSAFGGPYYFTTIADTVLESESSYDSLRVYAGQFLKVQDGKYLAPEKIGEKIRYYYSTHSIGGDGQTGLAEFEQIPYLPGMSIAMSNLNNKIYTDPDDPITIKDTTNFVKGINFNGGVLLDSIKIVNDTAKIKLDGDWYFLLK